MHAHLVRARPHPDGVDAPACSDPDVRTRAAEHQQRRLVDCPEIAQRRERSAIAAVRCGCEEEQVRGAGRERLDSGAPIGVAGHAVRFVDDDEVPGTGGDGRQHLGALDVIHGRDRRRQGRPRIDAHRKRRRQSPQQVAVDIRGGEGETTRQFLRPLLAQAGRRDDKDPIDRAALE